MDKQRVLIVEDTPFVSEIIKHQLTSENFDVVSIITQGDRALPAFRELVPDLVILDIVLPEKNGIEVAQSMIAHNPSVKIIAMSSLTDDETKNKATNAGCCDFLEKPFDKDVLLQKVTQALSSNLVA